MYDKVSIIIPVYNAKNFIERCIDSVLCQSYSDIEVITVDDGSSDGSGAILDMLEKQDRRILVIHQENTGVSVARNNGIKAATGKYILFVDADDMIEADAIEKLMDNSENDLVCGSYVTFKDKKQKKFCYEEKYYSGIKKIELINYVANAPWGKLFKREIIDRNNIYFPVDIPYGEDSIFLISYIKYAKDITVLNDIVYRYNVSNEGSAMKKFYPNMYEYLYMALEKKREFYNIYSENFNDISDRNNYYEMCIAHYVKHKYKIGILKAKEVFGISENTNLSIIKWKFRHAKEYIGYTVKYGERKAD